MRSELYSPSTELGQPRGLEFLNQRKNEDIGVPLLPRKASSSGEGGSVLGNYSSPLGLHHSRGAKKLQGGVWVHRPPPPSSAPVLIISGINSASLPSWPDQLLPGMAEYRYVPASCSSASGRIQTLPRILSRNSFPISCALIMSNRRKLIVINTLFQLFLDICAPSHSESQDFQIVLRSED